MSLDASKLENICELAGDILQARCPACAAGGNDRTGDHLRIYPDGRFGCCVHPKDGEHRKRIWALAGRKQHRPPSGTFSLRIKPPPALPAAQSVKTALTSFAARTLRTPVSESVSSESKALYHSPASQVLTRSQPELQSKYFRTLRTPIFNPRAYVSGYMPMYMCKDSDNGVLPVLTPLPTATANLPPTIAGPACQTSIRLPFLTAGGTLSIPFDSDPKYHWWKLGGQSVEQTRAEVLAWMAAERVGHNSRDRVGKE